MVLVSRLEAPSRAWTLRAGAFLLGGALAGASLWVVLKATVSRPDSPLLFVVWSAVAICPIALVAQRVAFAWLRPTPPLGAAIGACCPLIVVAALLLVTIVLDGLPTVSVLYEVAFFQLLLVPSSLLLAGVGAVTEWRLD